MRFLPARERTCLDYSLRQTPSSPQPTMIPPSNMVLLLLLPVAAAQIIPGEKSTHPLYHASSGSYSGCGPLPVPLLVGLVAADAMVSLLIVVVVFMCASPRDRPTQDGKVYINMPGRG
ncbi:hematopoietic cell signal transducer isoform X2 [Artibeus jamaicensis]|uniref:hematopoietic cell signal transducer isoform X2 n=1 Tax=Artibeus jamaicensis TaxID=9417 RepID=UPI00187C1AF5|nr:hematopoietic cell signal transducer isoform X2 [Artibeus jamaicensis]